VGASLGAEASLGALDDVYFLDGYNPRDAFWAKKYKVKNFKSFATGGIIDGKGQIAFYRGATAENYLAADMPIPMARGRLQMVPNPAKRRIRRTVAHEMGHVFAYNRWGSAKPPGWGVFLETEGFISDYGKKAWQASAASGEDFADFIMEYTVGMGPEALVAKSPKKFEALMEFLAGPDPFWALTRRRRTMAEEGDVQIVYMDDKGNVVPKAEATRAHIVEIIDGERFETYADI
jgi:hypothetical protein